MTIQTRPLTTAFALAGLLTAGQAISAPLFSDDYSSDTSANYDIGPTGVWGISGGTLNYSRNSGDNSWRTDYYMVKDASYSHATDAIVTISGQATITSTTNTERGQFGLVIGADAQYTTGVSGWMVYFDYNSGTLRFFTPSATTRDVLADDAGQGDQIGSGSLGGQTGTWTFNVTFDRVNSTTAGNVLIDIEVIAPDTTVFSESYDVVDQAAANQVGWRNRINNASVTTSFDNLSVTAVPEPGSLALMGLGGLLIARRRRG